ncbi:MAG TPA: NfeD family protein [Beijerinckiaceae bacterium]|nr:NfeD family protein [Beijerinckiaceae bacterium]
MVSYLAHLGAWTWVIVGIVLVGLEMVIPGTFMVWLGLAAIFTGLSMWALGLSWQAAMLLYAVLAIALAYVGRMFVGARAEERAPDLPNLGRRGQALVGRTFTLDAPIEQGEGRIRVDDTSWRVTGPDAPKGAAVRVVGVEGATLRVEGA